MRFLENFDRLSFWLGFITAGLFWWVAYQLWRRFPEIKKFFQSRLNLLRTRRSAGIDGALRHEVLKRAQKNHLAGILFSLDEIVVIPRLLAPPPLVDPENPDPIGSFRAPIVPNLPLVPQFSAQYGGDTLDLAALVRKGASIAVLGHPGSGKSVALAYLASLFSRQDARLGSSAQSFPIYLHINDLDLPVAESMDPLVPLSAAFAWHSPAGNRSQVTGFLKKAIDAQKAIFLLDGLDEIPYEKYGQAIDFLKRIVKTYPKLQIVTTASPNRAGGLVALGIEPFPLAGWSRKEIFNFSQRWGKLWTTLISAPGDNGQNRDVDPMLVNTWQISNGGFFTPLELTCRLWAAYSGDLAGNRGVDGISAYFSRLEAQGIHLISLASLADQLISQKKAFTSFIDAEKELEAAGFSYQNLRSETQEELPSIGMKPQNPIPNLNLNKNLRISSDEEKTIDQLLILGVLKEHPGERIAFTSPVLWGYIASLSNYTYDLSSKSPEDQPWSVAEEFFHYLLASTPAEWLKTYLANDADPFYFRSIQASLWMRDLSPENGSRSFIMRHILGLVQQESIPYPSRLALMGAASLSNDPALNLLMHQLSGSSSVAVRQIAALCAGLLADPKSLPDLTKAGTDEQELVRFAGCFAIAALETPEAQATLSNTITQADEHMRLVTAEAVAARPPWGHQLLQTAATSPDLLTRRSAIFGLQKIQAPWVAGLMEKLATEDSQYVVRNMAATVLDAIQNPRELTPGLQPPPVETPWLISFAAKSGQGVPRDESPVPLLLNAAKSGSLDQQIGAIQLLSRCEGLAAEEGIKAALGSPELELRVAAHYALWFFELNQPSPAFTLAAD